MELETVDSKTTALSLTEHTQHIGNATWCTLLSLTQLRCLELDHIQFDLHSVDRLLQMTQLTSLSLGKFNRIPIPIDDLSPLPLQHLSVHLCLVNRDFWTRLPSSLISLTLSASPLSGCSIPYIAIPYLQRIPKLVIYCKLEGRIIDLLSSHTQELIAHGSHTLHESETVTSCPQLRKLHLRLREPLNRDLLQNLCSQSSSLTSLELDNTGTCSERVDLFLAPSSQLAYLNLHYQGISMLDESYPGSFASTALRTLKLSHNALLDQSVQTITTCTTLTRLDLRHNRLTERCLSLLVAHPSIQHLSLTGNSITNYQEMESNEFINATKDERDGIEQLVTRNSLLQHGRQKQWLAMCVLTAALLYS